MTKATAPLADGVALLERAIGYALGTLQAVTPELLSRPTPCRGWDLRLLLLHVNASLDTLYEGIDDGHVGLAPDPGHDDLADPVAMFRGAARRVLGAWIETAPHKRAIAIAGCPLTTAAVASAGAVEIAVHGWDVSRACGHARPIPPALAQDLLELAPLLVTDATRHPLFAAAVAVPPSSSPGDRLVAYLGRRPDLPRAEPSDHGETTTRPPTAD